MCIIRNPGIFTLASTLGWLAVTLTKKASLLAFLYTTTLSTNLQNKIIHKKFNSTKLIYVLVVLINQIL